MTHQIKTIFQFPPIPDRRFDWVAFIDGDEEAGRYGYGPTEAEAISDFIENWADEYEQEDAEWRERNAEAAHCGGLSPLGEALAETVISIPLTEESMTDALNAMKKAGVAVDNRGWLK